MERGGPLFSLLALFCFSHSITCFWRLSSARETGALSGSDITEAICNASCGSRQHFYQQTKVPLGFCVLPVVRTIHFLNFLGGEFWGTTPFLAFSHFHPIRLDVYIIAAFVNPATRLRCRQVFWKALQNFTSTLGPRVVVIPTTRVSRHGHLLLLDRVTKKSQASLLKGTTSSSSIAL
jgi:hypothetical protein